MYHKKIIISPKCAENECAIQMYTCRMINKFLSIATESLASQWTETVLFEQNASVNLLPRLFYDVNQLNSALRK